MELLKSKAQEKHLEKLDEDSEIACITSKVESFHRFFCGINS